MTQPAFGTYAPSPWVKFLLLLSQNTVLGRGKARRTIAGLLKDAHTGPLDAHLWGQPARIHVGANNNELKALLNPASFNRAELAVMRTHLPRENGVFVDVGANVGMVSLAARAHLDTGTVLSIEPQPAMYERLEFTLLEAGQGDGVDHVLRQAAVGPQRGVAELSVPDQPGMATLAISGTEGETVEVDLIPLAEICAEAGLSHIDVLKIDVEGYEDQALLPLFETGPEALWPRVIIMEHCHSARWSRDVVADIIARGYCELRRDRQNVCLQREAP
ncbi:MAG: FkbM family methyltransferase [Hyphomonadaceae bacterium]|nr:FkbM family methyltransferase [Hyphomonadaceae bacterium]